MSEKVRIAIGADHRGFVLKEFLKQHVHYQWIDVGTTHVEKTDYPIFAQAVVSQITQGKADYGILLCGSGAGMVIAANRTPGIRAAVAWNVDVARAIKADDNCTILVLPADYISSEVALELVHAWMSTQFKAGYYQERLSMIDKE